MRIHFRIYSFVLLISSVLLLAALFFSRTLNYSFLPVLITFAVFLTILLPVLIFKVGHPLFQIQKALETKNPGNLENLVKRKDEFGQLASLVLSLFEQKTELLAQIHEREKTENALRESEKRYRSLVETLPDAIILVDHEGRILLRNGKALELSRYGTETFAEESSIFDFLPSDTRQQMKTVLKEAGQKGYNRAVECTITRSDKSIFNAEINISPVSIQDITGGLVCIIRDVTEKKKAQNEKSKLEEQFRAVYKMEAIGQLAGGIAHDFNNILGAISGYADIIRHRYTGDEKLEKYSQKILSAATRASDLTNKLLTFARKSKLQMNGFDVHSLLIDMTELLEHTIDKKITVSCDLQAQESIVVGDSAQFQSAIMNLTLNARDAMAEGGEIFISTENINLDKDFSRLRAYTIAPGHYISISVKDTGTGMDKQVLEHLFEPFFTTKEPGKGTGLGLASVYGTIKSHNGYIDVESESEKGTTITMYFPVTHRKKCDNPTTPKVFKHGKGHILVVDDERFMVDAVQEMLSWLGYTVSVCLNGNEAVEIFKEQSNMIDLVILDMMMPGINGRECFNRMKEIDKDVKALLSTGYRIDEERQDILNEGFSGIIQKPFVSAQLAQVVQEALCK